ncbi:MAG: BACON domain-containing protein, partial [Prevotella sp.]|nr:BACON domain-containing protein [Prevotella sp.]
MTKNILKYLFLLLATTSFAACSSSDSDEPAAGGVTLSTTEVNVDYDVTWYEVGVTSRSVWSARSDASWLTLKSANGVGGSEKLTFEMTKNTSKDARTATITITCGSSTSTLKVTQAGTT